MAVDGEIKEKKKKKKIKEEEVEETAKEGGTKNKSKYQHASVQTTEQSWGNICEEEQHEYDAPEKKKKKKIKEEKVEANDLFALCCDASVQTAVKTEQLEIDISEGGQEKSDLPQKEKKKKRKIKKESEHLQENVIEISEAEEKMDEECLVKKKKRKKKETKVKEEEIDVGHYEKIDKKKKKKRKNMEDEEQNPESEDGEVKKTRKKTEANVKEEREEKQTEKKKKKEKNTNLKTENNEARVKGDKEKKVKTKKEKSAPIEEEMSVNTEKKSKKKKKRLENLDEGQRMQDARTKAKTGDVIGEMMSSKHKMKKNIKLEVDVVTEMEEELHDKKTKHDKNKSREKSDVVFLSSKSGNQDEISIDQARRLALQKEIDKESQPKPNLGQWSTAQFDSSDRQTKFMRLMGGFKKSSQPITGSSGQANMALGREAQQTLQQGLLGEFESTRSRHLDFRNKGIGLGFTPPSNKKFAIDVNARNSMRFDD